MKIFQSVMAILSKYLPVWIVLSSIIAYMLPQAFEPISQLTGPALGLIFLLMGLSLSTEALASVIKRPVHLFTGVLFKWTITVTVSIVIAYVFFKDETEIAMGIILAGVVPSGTSANLYTFMAGGEVALSVSMAAADTFISPVLTPFLTQFFAGQFIPVDFWALFFSIIYIVFVPLLTGLFLQWKWPKRTVYIKPYTSLLSTLALFVVVLSVVSNAQSSLADSLHWLPLIFIAVFIQVAFPMLAGYSLSRFFRIPERNCRAILFHTGICNTALAATLAMEHISSAAAVPAVANMVVNLSLGAWVANRLSAKEITKDASYKGKQVV
ncbi:bile acid:sodium symporter family protein [Bacillus thermotolerans]|uniref:bile acid:sodium symporter family protein n=1 Tax=Bacillus thermotolerans TaxID=1221996 RepID=UPI00057EB876|nr:bile acid:sodium symporter family protein [Bacillus thermotolerans]KKB33276.1 Sodium-dependent transporter [Bacillus thermotolerans]